MAGEMTSVKFEWVDVEAEDEPSFVEPPSISTSTANSMDISYNESSNDSASMETKPYPSTSCGKAAINVPGRDTLLFNGRYFKIIKQMGETDHQLIAGGVIAVCQFCSTPRAIKGSLKITSNFLQHLKAKHPVNYEEYLSEKKTKRIHTRQMFQPKPKFDDKLFAFVVDCFLPMNVVEKPSFIALFERNGPRICGADQIAGVLKAKYTNLVANLRSLLKDVPYLCATADIWTWQRQSYFAYTCHWMDPTNFNRESAALAFFRLLENTKFEQSIDLIRLLNTDWHIDEKKIVCIVTDNVSDLAPDLKELGIERGYEGNDMDEFSQGNFEPITISDSDRFCNHNKSSSYTLNLLRVKDFMNILRANHRAHEKHKHAFAHCNTIWHEFSKKETAKLVRARLNCALKTPNARCCNSLQESLKQLLELRDIFDDLSSALGVTKFHCTEIQYLEEYVSLMEPIANGLEFLQNPATSYYGYFLPTLVTIKVKLRKLHESGDLIYLKEIAREMERALVKRFKSFFELSTECNDAIVAAISCPAIKMKFIKPLSETAPYVTADHLKGLFLEYALEFQNGCQMVKIEIEESVPDYDFLDFDQNTEETKLQKKSHILDEQLGINEYLNDSDSSLASLDRYPIIKNVFRKYNTPLASSARVKEMLPFGDIIKSLRNQNLTDDQFERLVLLRANKAV